MARIPKANTAEERSSDGVSLLISILVRFPQIGTIHFESKNRILRLNFMLARSLSPAEISEVQTKMAEHIKAYHHVTGRKPELLFGSRGIDFRKIAHGGMAVRFPADCRAPAFVDAQMFQVWMWQGPYKTKSLVIIKCTNDALHDHPAPQ